VRVTLRRIGRVYAWNERDIETITDDEAAAMLKDIAQRSKRAMAKGPPHRRQSPKQHSFARLCRGWVSNLSGRRPLPPGVDLLFASIACGPPAAPVSPPAWTATSSK
jgi:hypothetical protein